jgi:chromosome segregation ATPase
MSDILVWLRSWNPVTTPRFVEAADEIERLRHEKTEYERLLAEAGEAFTKGSACIDGLRRDNERLLLKANSLHDDLHEAEAELAEARGLLREAKEKLGDLHNTNADQFVDDGIGLDGAALIERIDAALAEKL